YRSVLRDPPPLRALELGVGTDDVRRERVAPVTDRDPVEVDADRRLVSNVARWVETGDHAVHDGAARDDDLAVLRDERIGHGRRKSVADPVPLRADRLVELDLEERARRDRVRGRRRGLRSDRRTALDFRGPARDRREREDRGECPEPAHRMLPPCAAFYGPGARRRDEVRACKGRADRARPDDAREAAHGSCIRPTSHSTGESAMRRHRAIRCIILLAALALPASCGRTGVESEPGPAYALEVTNPRPYPMIISYDDGSGVRLLGIVQPNGATRFVITTPASREI